MKTFTFRYNPKSTPKDLFSRLKKAAGARIADVEKDEASSNSIAAILSTMTAGRIALFYAIAGQKPDSIYHLAQLVGRAPSNINEDVKVLEGLGLIRLVSEKDGGRERLRPLALFDHLVFDFGKALSADSHKKPAAS